MRFNKIQGSVLGVIGCAFLIAVPSIIEVYHGMLYYMLVALLLVLTILRDVPKWEQKLNEKFRRRWGKSRNSSFCINVIREGFRGFLSMVVMVSLSQYIFYDRTPLEIIGKVPGKALALILVILLFFSLLLGIISPYEKEKKYQRITWEITNRKEQPGR